MLFKRNWWRVWLFCVFFLILKLRDHYFRISFSWSWLSIWAHFQNILNSGLSNHIIASFFSNYLLKMFPGNRTLRVISWWLMTCTWNWAALSLIRLWKELLVRKIIKASFLGSIYSSRKTRLSRKFFWRKIWLSFRIIMRWHLSSWERMQGWDLILQRHSFSISMNAVLSHLMWRKVSWASIFQSAPTTWLACDWSDRFFSFLVRFSRHDGDVFRL